VARKPSMPGQPPFAHTLPRLTFGMSPEDGRCLKVIDRAIRVHTGHRRRIHYTVLIRTALRLVANAPKLPSGKRILEAYESALALDQRRQPRRKKAASPPSRPAPRKAKRDRATEAI
jgi:hypothetical protein